MSGIRINYLLTSDFTAVNYTLLENGLLFSMSVFCIWVTSI